MMNNFVSRTMRFSRLCVSVFPLPMLSLTHNFICQNLTESLNPSFYLLSAALCGRDSNIYQTWNLFVCISKPLSPSGLGIGVGGGWWEDWLTSPDWWAVSWSNVVLLPYSPVKVNTEFCVPDEEATRGWSLLQSGFLNGNSTWVWCCLLFQYTQVIPWFFQLDLVVLPFRLYAHTSAIYMGFALIILYLLSECFWFLGKIGGFQWCLVYSRAQ